MREYAELLKKVMREGELRETRTGKRAFSLFGQALRLDLREGFPLLTTKKMAFEAIAAETLWQLSGSSSVADLGKHSGLWSPWADESGMLETSYGRMMRRFPSSERGMPEKGLWPLSGESLTTDQLSLVLDDLRFKRESRRMHVSLWEPLQARLSKLPPCVTSMTFTSHKGQLNVAVSQRSADLCLGLPFDLAGVALLTHLMASSAGMRAGSMLWSIADAHVYESHEAGAREQAERSPLALPTMRVSFHKERLESYERRDFELIGYQCHERIMFDLAV